MGEPGLRGPWESPSSTFSNLEGSISQSSGYGSEDTSVTSAISSTLATPTAPSLVSSPKQSLSPILKPILKRQDSTFQADAGSESESGYDSDGSWYDSDAEFEYSFSVENSNWDSLVALIPGEASGDACGTHIDDESGDDSFISFESAVRFDPKIEYIEAPEFAEDEVTDAEMTFHEMVKLAAMSSHLLLDGVGPEDGSLDDRVVGESEEDSPDAVDLDKRLFAAYMNGINGIADSDFKSHLHARVGDIKSGRAETPFLDSDNVVEIYLDNILSHVIGVFRNLVVKEELDELVTLSGEKTSLQQLDQSSHSEFEVCNKVLLDKIEAVLLERLGQGNVEIGPDELTFFAGGVAHMLGSSDSDTGYD